MFNFNAILLPNDSPKLHSACSLKDVLINVPAPDFSWGSQLLKRCAETASTAASTSSRVSWRRSSTATTPAPNWRRPISWKWPSAFSNSSGSSSSFLRGTITKATLTAGGSLSTSSLFIPPEEDLAGSSSISTTPSERALLLAPLLRQLLLNRARMVCNSLTSGGPSGDPGRDAVNYKLWGTVVLTSLMKVGD